MQLTGEYKIPAPRERVWEALNDPEMLAKAIPGCESVDKKSDTEMEVVATAKVGPVKAKFKGKLSLSEMDPPNGYKITGEGAGGAAGFAKGGAVVKLIAESPEITVLSYEVNATVGGKIAQIGQRFIDATAKKLSVEFFSSFSELLGGAAAATPQTTPSAAAESAQSDKEGVSPIIWIGGAILFTILLLALVAGS
jgi:hypothetical protein